MSGSRLSRRSLLVTLLAGGVVACAPPWQRPAQTPLPTPTPPPTPTMTPAPVRISASSAPPRPVASDATPTALSAAPSIPALRGAGQLLYLGVEGSRAGVISISADGSRRRMLVEGNWSLVAWSPDGQRFAVASAPGSPPLRVVLYSAAAETIQRVALPGRLLAGPLWAPDSETVFITTWTEAGTSH